MIEHLSAIVNFMLQALLAVWPYLLITIPLAVAVNLSGASRYIERAFQARPLVAVVLAAAVGAFSPFCSCTVIPVVASLLIGGLPLAPVMAFWIASPSMDPETFFLSVALLGWPLAVWRLAGALLLSLGAGFATHFLTRQGWLGEDVLRSGDSRRDSAARAPAPVLQQATLAAGVVPLPVFSTGATALTAGGEAQNPATCRAGEENACAIRPVPFWPKLWRETRAATWMVVKFMSLAFFLEALISLYVPQAWIVALLGRQNPLAIPAAALLGVPVYTSNLAALPMIGGLLTRGMDPAAALAFLIAGPTTTLPAMAAVWGLVKKRVFTLYLLLALGGAVALGALYAFAQVL